MPTSPMSHSEVKSVEDMLEVSPSAHSPGSALYSGSADNPRAKAHGPKHASGTKGHLSNSESGFGKKGSGLSRNIAAGKKAASSKDV
jgi:hypothetical protein